MPFIKRGRYFYSPSGSGRRWTKKQVRFYYATKGFRRLRIRKGRRIKRKHY